MNEGLLDGKVAVITGAAGGIGRAEALLFAQQGARVVVADSGVERDGEGGAEEPARQLVGEIVAAGGQAAAYCDSIATPAGAAGVVAAAMEHFGRLDILVNGAGILRDQPLLEMSENAWDAVVGVHLKGTFLCTQAAAKQMVLQAEGGRIINTTGVQGLQGSSGQANVSAAQAGIYGLTRAAAIELQKHRITVNALAPLAKTRMTEDQPTFEGLEGLTPEHVAPAALFLASDLCADRSGHVLAVAGGRLYALRLVEGRGKQKAEDAVWTAEEIGEHWDAITR